jgi:hypothetical protein
VIVTARQQRTEAKRVTIAENTQGWFPALL